MIVEETLLSSNDRRKSAIFVKELHKKLKFRQRIIKNVNFIEKDVKKNEQNKL